MKKTQPSLTTVMLMVLFGIIIIFISCGYRTPGNVKSSEAVKQVSAGERTEANAAWWGFDETDATDALQSAVNSGAKKVIVPNMDRDWVVRPIKLAGNQELVFEDGVIVTAKKGEFKGKNDCLFSADGIGNIILRGYGATLRMQKQDYMSDAYEKAEWRMVIALRSCTNAEVLGLTLKDSGGDGIYIGVSGDQKFCKNIHIKDVVCDNNYRQGISVIGAENLLIENCVFRNTGGTPPAAGIDLEPNYPDEVLKNCTIRSSIMENNDGAGILLYLRQLSSRPGDVSILFQNCCVTSTTGSGIIVGAVADDGPNGSIVFKNCTVEQTAGVGAQVYDKSAVRARVVFEGCTWKDTALRDDPAVLAPLWINLRRPEITKHYGGIDFIDCCIEDGKNRPFLAVTEQESSFGVSDITGTITVRNPYGARMDAGKKSAGVTLKVTGEK